MIYNGDKKFDRLILFGLIWSCILGWTIYSQQVLLTGAFKLHLEDHLDSGDYA